MNIPLEKRLKKRLHVEIGYLQDELVEILYNVSNNLVMYGGTAVWRCYKGNRFSEDLDFYGQLDVKLFVKKLKERGLTLNKEKQTENLIFMKVSNGRVEVRLEINKSLAKKGTIVAYEKMDGSFFDVYALTVDEIILEKIDAYNSRRFIRDLYDIYHLVRTYAIDSGTKSKIKEFIDSIQPPVNENVLKALVYSGVPPTFKTMVNYLRSI